MFYETAEKVAQRRSGKKVFLKISHNSQENISARDSFLIKLRTQACNFIKKDTLAQVFSCEFCEIFKDSYFYRSPPVAASETAISWSRYCNNLNRDLTIYCRYFIGVLIVDGE